MARTPNEKKPEPEMRLDGWDRFEKAVDAAVKSGPKHKTGEAQKPTRQPRKPT